MRSPYLCPLYLLLLCAFVPTSHAEPRVEPSRAGHNFFVTLDPLFMETTGRTGGRVTMSFNDNTTTGVDKAMLGADGITNQAHMPRMTFGYRWNHSSGISLGGQARFQDLKDAHDGGAPLAPGTTELANFATTSETEMLEVYTGDFEGVAAFSRWGLTLEGSYGSRRAKFRSEGEIEAFGVFTSGNFVQLQLSNGSAFRGAGNVVGYTLTYRVPQIPVSVFVGRRTADLDGRSDSFGRSVGAIASSPSAPLIGAATVRRNNESRTDLMIGETRYGLQADFGQPDGRYRSFARITYEVMGWDLDGPPTGGAGFGGTIGNLTTNSFASAGLGGAVLKGWSLAVGMAF